MTTEERQRRRTWEQDPYLVEATLTLAEWRQRRNRPFVEIVTRHDDGRLN